MISERVEGSTDVSNLKVARTTVILRAGRHERFGRVHYSEKINVNKTFPIYHVLVAKSSMSPLSLVNIQTRGRDRKIGVEARRK